MSAGAVALLAAALGLGCLLPGPWPLAVAAAAALGVMGLLGAVRGRPGAGPALRRGRRLALTALALCALGSGLAGAHLALLDRGPLSELAQRGGRAGMTATVVTDARSTPYGAWLLVRVDDVGGLPTRARGLLRLAPPAKGSVASTGPAMEAVPPLGARIRFTASARPLGGEGFEGHLRRLHAGVALRPAGELEVVAAPPDWLAATTTVRGRVRAAASRWLPHDHAVLLTGGVAGDQRQAQFEATGLTHLVAVSGSNVALVVAGALGVAALTGAGIRAAS